MSAKKFFWGFLAVVLTAQTAMAGGYVELLTPGELLGGTSTSHNATVIEGTTVYAFWAQGDGGAHITAVDAVTKTGSDLMTNAAWQTASGGSSFTVFYGPSIIGDDIVFSDSSTDAVWKVNKNTGAVSEYVSKAVIDAYIGGTGPSLLTPQTATPTGEYAFYESDTDSVLVTTGAGAVTTLVSDVQLAATAGSDSISGGLTFVGNDLYWCNSSSDGVYKWDTVGGTGSTVLTTAQIMAVTGEDGAGTFADIYAAPDGNVYFYESKADAILSFEPTDAPGTLAVVLSEADLVAGPAGSDSVSSMTWYNGKLAWTGITTTVNGLYAVPEPGTLVLLLAGGLAMAGWRRR